VHAFEVLGDAVRRRILELLADGEQTSGAVTVAIRAEFGISQPAVSQHLKVLRDNGFATVRADGTRRLYAVDATGLAVVDEWLDRFRAGRPEQFWNQRLDALHTELARGQRATRQQDASTSEPTVRKQSARAAPRLRGSIAASPSERGADLARRDEESA
jgi:DNA-binding transcriptional ArsR family regulator